LLAETVHQAEFSQPVQAVDVGKSMTETLNALLNDRDVVEY
jgi:hypothetical protein